MSAPSLITAAITVRIPWSPAIAYGRKRVENRGRRIAARHIGTRVAIHAGSTVDTAGMRDHRIVQWLIGNPEAARGGTFDPLLVQHLRGRILAVATIVGCHQADGARAYATCCHPWGEREYATPAFPAGRLAQHIELDDVVSLDEPYGPVVGALRVPWELPADVAADLNQLVGSRR